MHALAPDADANEPAAHAAHAVAPNDPLNEPAAHAVHADAPNTAAHTCPGGQRTGNTAGDHEPNAHNNGALDPDGQ